MTALPCRRSPTPKADAGLPPRRLGRPAEGPRPRAAVPTLAGPARRARRCGAGPPGAGRVRRPEDGRGRSSNVYPEPGPGRAPRRAEHAGRPGRFAKDLLAAVGRGRVPPPTSRPTSIRQLRNHKDAEVNAEIAKVWGTVRETSADRAKVDRRVSKASCSPKPDQRARRRTRPGRLRQDLPAVPHPVRHRRQGRPRADRLEPGRPRIRPVERARPDRPDRQGLPRPRRRHHRRPGPHRDHPRRGQGRDHAQTANETVVIPRRRDRGAARRASSR